MLDFLKLDFRPKANPEAVVQVGAVRFTVLTSQLIRLEYDPTETFEDRPSQVFWFRDRPLPKFNYEADEKDILIETEHLRLTYQITDSGFYHRYLQIYIKDTNFTWHYGQENHTNLGGTVRTLDQTNGAIPLKPGLLARTGWAIVDDSASLVFNENGWLEPRNSPPLAEDLYFFGYGHDYTRCIQDFQELSGKIPIIPRFALGNWWSRYWEYEQDELISLMHDFKDHHMPLSVCIVDMDWHIVETGNESSGWTGYTWNPKLFPEPQRFFEEIDKLGLKTALNLHPASGVYPHETKYAEMAQRLGVDPESEQPIPFEIANPEFTDAYLDILHHPLEKMGVDFWWLDWQQGTKTTLAGLDPLFWLNHIHFYDRARDSTKRPFIFSRWGGFGSQRYPIGFSGDTFATWETLQFQPYFTATAANTAYGWWSHDIGGHMGGVNDPELFVRWLQYGVFSPILRIHTTKNPYLERRPWTLDADIEKKAAQALNLRHTLIPYIYTTAWLNHHEGILPIRPMYHLYPEENDAYVCPNQYSFGRELIAVPFTTPKNADTQLSRQVVWFPEGSWFDFFTGERYQGKGWCAIYGTLDQIPVYARAGAIIPLNSQVSWSNTGLPRELTLKIFPGASNTYQLYEDDGITSAYTHGAFALTTFSQDWQSKKITLNIEPAQGELSLLPDERTYKLIFYALNQPDGCRIMINGQEQSVETYYDQNQHQLTITDLILPIEKQLTVEIKSGSGLLYTQQQLNERLVRLLDIFRLNVDVKYQLLNHLDEFIKNPMILINYADRMEEAHLLVLVETWMDKQEHKLPDNPEEAFQQIVNQIYYP